MNFAAKGEDADGDSPPHAPKYGSGSGDGLHHIEEGDEEEGESDLEDTSGRNTPLQSTHKDTRDAHKDSKHAAGESPPPPPPPSAQATQVAHPVKGPAAAKAAAQSLLQQQSGINTESQSKSAKKTFTYFDGTNAMLKWIWRLSESVFW